MELKPLFRKLISYWNLYKYNKLYALSVSTENNNKINIIYVLHAYSNLKTGGDKVIYKQSDIINQLGIQNVRSQVLHVENTNFQHRWFEHNVSFKKDTRLNPQTDFVILPEVMVVPHARLLIKLGIRYGIYVQNGYSISIPLFNSDYESVKEAYNHAEIILSISDDTSDCLKLAFPSLVSKIYRIFCSVDLEKFRPNAEKENLITYMPRKLARHADIVKFFLKENLPIGWKLHSIDGLTETGVATILAKSKIFLSFSELEGLSLPPIEAALSGNLVIGYTGEAAREYWHSPVFTEISCGDIKTFIKEILAKIHALETEDFSRDFTNTQAYLVNRYSKQAENKSIVEFTNQVASLMKS